MTTFEEQVAALNQARLAWWEQRLVPLDPPLPPLDVAVRKVVTAGPWCMADVAPIDRPGLRTLVARTTPSSTDQSWYTIQNIGSNAADLWVYDEIGGWGITAEGLVSELAQLNVSAITVHLNSPGGDVFAGIAIMNALRDHPAQVTVKVDALAASIASVIAQAGDEVIMGRNSMMMIHNASGFAMGEASDMQAMADLLKQTTDNIAQVYTERAGGEKAAWLAAMNAETWYTAKEAVAAGLADSVAPMPAEREAHQQAAGFDLTHFKNKAVTLPELEDEPALPPVAMVHPGHFDSSLFRTAVTAGKPVEATLDVDLFRAAMHLVTNNVPDGPTVTPDTPKPAPVAGIESSMFAQAIREAL